MSADDHTQSVEYRDIPGFPGYRVGSDGSFWTRWVRGRHRLGPDWRPMKPVLQKQSGYLNIALRRDGEPLQFRAHRVVLEVFVGPCPLGMEACHFPDPSRTNIRLDNLKWGTKAENYEHREMHGRLRKGSGVGTSKLIESDIGQIAALLAAGLTHAEIARQFGVSKVTIGRIASGRDWKSESYVVLSAIGSYHIPVDRKAGLKPEDIVAIRRLLSTGTDRSEVASQFGVTRGMIGLIANGRAWASVDEGKDLPIPMPKPVGSQKGKAKLTEADIPEIRRMISEGLSAVKIAARYGIGARAIGYIKQGKTWTHVPA